VIHCHGAPGSRFQLRCFDHAFADVGMRVVTVDRSGLWRLLIRARTSPRERPTDVAAGPPSHVAGRSSARPARSPATSTTDRARPRPGRRGRRVHPADAPAPAVVRRKGRCSAPRGTQSAGTGRLVWKTPRATRTTRLTSSLMTAQADVRPAGPGANGDTDVRPRPHDVRGPCRPGPVP